MRVVGEGAAEYGLSDLSLHGGTALAAYHLGHRVSEDLDFFAGPALNARAFGEWLKVRVEGAGFGWEPFAPASMGFARYVASGGNGPAIRVDIAVSSPFQLAPPDIAEEGIQVASYRDLCAGKLHAACDRFELRDFVDVHAILTIAAHGSPPGEDEIRARFRRVLADVLESDPGLDARYVGQGLRRALGQEIVRRLPIALLAEIADEDVQRTITLCVDECEARFARDFGAR